MTELEKQQLVDAVITQLKNEGTDVSSASVVEDVNGVSYILCYDTNGNIVRVSPDTINQQESTNKTAIEALGKKVDDNETVIANETKRAHDAEQALGMALQNGLNQEATARGNLAKEIKSNAMQYDTLGVYVRADKAEIYGRSIDTTPRVVEFPAATTEKAGVMSATDKRALDNVDNKINQAIADIVDSAPESFDTLKEVATWIEDDKTGAAAMAQAISDNTKVINEEKERSLTADAELINAINEEAERVDNKMAQAKTELVNGDVIVGQSREVYSRTGKPDSATFLKRTTAGGTSIGGGVATLKQVGGNIVKNLVDATNTNSFWGITSFNNDVFYSSPSAGGITMKSLSTVMDSHKYYIRVEVYSNSAVIMRDMLGNDNRTTATSSWQSISVLNSNPTSKNMTIFESGGSNGIFMRHPFIIDLTEMFGEGKEPDKATCDKLFGTMDALPMGLTVANPTSFKSVGYNQANPANILVGKGIENGAIVDKADSNIAVIECLPCKIGVGENNGYCIHGDFAEGEEVVYLSPLNPMTTDGELYMHQLYRNADKGTYVPRIKGYMLVEVPKVTNLCAHFHWSGDRATTDYEPYVESSVALPTIPEMSEWGLAGIQASGIQDSVNLENNTYTKRIDCLDLGNINYQYRSPSETYPYGFFVTSIKNARFSKTNALMCEKYTHGSFAVDKAIMANTVNNYTFYIIDSSYTDAVSLKNALEGVKLYYEIIPQEYPIVTKAAPNYIGSDYGVEKFTGSRVPLVANILFYMRSLVSETRNFLDRLMAGLGTSDATVVADRILAVVNPAVEPANVEPETPIEE